MPRNRHRRLAVKGNDPGELNQCLSLQVSEYAETASGFAENVWVTVDSTVWAEVTEEGGETYIAADGDRADRRVVIRIHPRAGVAPTITKFLWGSRAFVVEATTLTPDRAWLQCHCKEAALDG